MAERDVIREFLVSIGYTTDATSERKFNEGLEKTKAAVAKMAAAVVAGMGAITVATNKVAESFDNLYYMSQRTNASVENIKSLSYAVSQLGGTYQGSLGSIEAFGKALRTNPGYGSLVRSLGVATQENGKLRDTVAIMKDLGKVLQSKPYYIAYQYANMFGMDEATFRALMSGELTSRIDEYNRKLTALGVDQSSVAKKSQEYESSMRSLRATIEGVATAVADRLLPRFNEWVKAIDAWLMAHSKDIVQFFEDLAIWIENNVKAFIKFISEGGNPAVEMFKKISDSVESLTKVLAAFAVFLGTTWLVGVTSAFAKVGLSWSALLLRLGIPAAMIGGAEYARQALGIPGGDGGVVGSQKLRGLSGGSLESNLERRRAGAAAAKPEGWGAWLGRQWSERPKWLGGTGGGSGGGSKAPISGTSFSQKAPGIMTRLMADFGLTKEQAAGVMGNLGHESVGLSVLQEKDPINGGIGGYGWAQWTGPRRRAFFAWAKANNLDPASDEANYGFLRHELNTNHKGAIERVKGARTVQEAMYAFEDSYEKAGVKAYGSRMAYANRAMAAFGSGSSGTATASGGGGFFGWLAGLMSNTAQARTAPSSSSAPFNANRFNGAGRMSDAFNASMTPWAGGGTAPLTLGGANDNSRTWTLNQTTNINVTGGSDPSGTAREVDKATAGTNAALLRNSQSAFR